MGWVLHNRDHLGGHEPGGSHGSPRARHLRDLDRSPNVGDLDPPAGSAGLDLEPLDPRSHVDEDFHAVTFHRYQATYQRCRQRDVWVRVGQDQDVPDEPWGWPQSDEELVELQGRLRIAAASALATHPWQPSGERPVLGGCFVAYARGGTGPGRPGDRAWVAVVAWRGGDSPDRGARRTNQHLRGASTPGRPRQADDILAQSVVSTTVPAAYVPGLLALREGRVLGAALAALDLRPELLLLDASGLDHPRGAGLAVHLGAALDLPTVGVTRRPLVASGDQPELRRGAVAPLQVGSRCVAFWVCTKTGTQPLVAHGGWRTSPETAVRVVLEASTPAARTPVPLQEARRVAREARSLATAG